MADLSKTAETLVDQLYAYIGGANQSEFSEADCLTYLNDGYVRVLKGSFYDDTGRLQVHRWGFVHQHAVLRTWADVALDAADIALSDQATYCRVTDNGGTDGFVSEMIGAEASFAGGGTYRVQAIDGQAVLRLVPRTGDNTTTAGCAVETGDFTVEAGSCLLPSDYGGLWKPFEHEYSSTETLPDLKETNPEQIREWWRRYDDADPDVPEWFGIEPLPKELWSASTVDRYHVLFYPRPDATYVLNYSYRRNADALTNAAVYPVGPPEMAEVLLLAGKVELDRARGISDSVFEPTYQQALREMVAFDRAQHRQRMEPESLSDQVDRP